MKSRERAILHSRLFIIKKECVKEGDKCGYCRLRVRGHVRAMNHKTEGEEKERGMGVEDWVMGGRGADKWKAANTANCGFGSLSLMLNNSSSSLSVSSTIRVTKSCNSGK